MWFLLCHQLHLKLNYGLSSNTATFDKLTVCLKRQWWQLLPLGGIVCTVPREVRHTSLGFYGAGCPHLGVECALGKINKLLMHFGCPSSLGIEMKTSLELMILELGVSLQPLEESYVR